MCDDGSDIALDRAGRHLQLLCNAVVRQVFEPVKQERLPRPFGHVVECAADSVTRLFDENELIQAGSGVVELCAQSAPAAGARPPLRTAH